MKVISDIRTGELTEIPADALVIRGDKSFVATLTREHEVAFKEVTICESDGKTARLSGGVTEGEHVIASPGQSLTEGQQVRPVTAE